MKITLAPQWCTTQNWNKILIVLESTHTYTSSTGNTARHYRFDTNTDFAATNALEHITYKSTGTKPLTDNGELLIEVGNKSFHDMLRLRRCKKFHLDLSSNPTSFVLPDCC